MEQHEIDQVLAEYHPFQMYVDKSIYTIRKGRTLVNVDVGSDSCCVKIQRADGGIGLIAITPEELKQAIDAWFRNRV